MEEYSRNSMTHMNKDLATVKGDVRFIHKKVSDLTGNETFTMSDKTVIKNECGFEVIDINKYNPNIHNHANKGKTILFDNLAKNG